MRGSQTKGTCGSLAETQVYRDYWKAYTQATGLPLRLHDAAQAGFAVDLGKGVSPLCMLLARTNISCQACLAMQQRLEQEARIKPKTLKCFAGLCETAVPVRVGENIIAWLETGHILIDHPTKSKPRGPQANRHPDSHRRANSTRATRRDQSHPRSNEHQKRRRRPERMDLH